MITAHPGLPEFDYIKPTTLEEASTFLAQHTGEARAFIGGTDTFVRMRDGAWQDKYLVDVKGLPGMNDLKFDPAKGLTVGAAVNMNRLIASPEVNEHYPVLAEAAHTVASYQLRTRATIAGNICNASPAGDTIGVVPGARCEAARARRRWRSRRSAAHVLQRPRQDGVESGRHRDGGRVSDSAAGRAGQVHQAGPQRDRRSGDRGRDGLRVSRSARPSGYRFLVALASVAPTPLLLDMALLSEKPITRGDDRRSGRGGDECREAHRRRARFGAVSHVDGAEFDAEGVDGCVGEISEDSR